MGKPITTDSKIKHAMILIFDWYYCFCGCGLIGKSLYHIGHQNRHKKSSEETKRKMSESARVAINSGRFKKGMVSYFKGKIPWSKGLTKESDERIKKQSSSIKNRYNNGLRSWSYGLTNETDERVKKTSEKMGKTIKEQFSSGKRISWQKGYTKETHPSLKKLSETRRNTPMTQKQFESYTRIANEFRNGKCSKIEIKIQEKLKENNILFEYHAFLYGIPDIRLTGTQILIFADGCYWHGCPECNNCILNDKKRQQKVHNIHRKDDIIANTLKNQGYIVLRYWEHEINNNIDDIVKEIVETKTKQDLLVAFEQVNALHLMV